MRSTIEKEKLDLFWKKYQEENPDFTKYVISNNDKVNFIYSYERAKNYFYEKFDETIKVIVTKIISKKDIKHLLYYAKTTGNFDEVKVYSFCGYVDTKLCDELKKISSEYKRELTVNMLARYLENQVLTDTIQLLVDIHLNTVKEITAYGKMIFDILKKNLKYKEVLPKIEPLREKIRVLLNVEELEGVFQSCDFSNCKIMDINFTKVFVKSFSREKNNIYDEMSTFYNCSFINTVFERDKKRMCPTYYYCLKYQFCNMENVKFIGSIAGSKFIYSNLRNGYIHPECFSRGIKFISCNLCLFVHEIHSVLGNKKNTGKDIYEAIDCTFEDVNSVKKMMTMEIDVLKNELTGKTKKIQKLEKKLENENNLCKICYINNANIVIIPCGHLFCALCIERIKFCSFCRQKIKKVYKVYI